MILPPSKVKRLRKATSPDTVLGVGATFITPGQSLTFTEHPWQTCNAQSGTPTGPFLVAPSGAVDQGDTCQLVEWCTGS